MCLLNYLTNHPSRLKAHSLQKVKPGCGIRDLAPGSPQYQPGPCPLGIAKFLLSSTIQDWAMRLEGEEQPPSSPLVLQSSRTLGKTTYTIPAPGTLPTVLVSS